MSPEQRSLLTQHHTQLFTRGRTKLCWPLMPVHRARHSPQSCSQHWLQHTHLSFIPTPDWFSFQFWLTLHPRAIKTWSEKAFAGYPRLNDLNAHLQLTAFYCCCFWHKESLDENKQILGKNYSRKSWIFMDCTQKPDWQVNASGRDKRSDRGVTFIYAVCI